MHSTNSAHRIHRTFAVDHLRTGAAHTFTYDATGESGEPALRGAFALHPRLEVRNPRNELVAARTYYRRDAIGEQALRRFMDKGAHRLARRYAVDQPMSDDWASASAIKRAGLSVALEGTHTAAHFLPVYFQAARLLMRQSTTNPDGQRNAYHVFINTDCTDELRRGVAPVIGVGHGDQAGAGWEPFNKTVGIGRDVLAQQFSARTELETCYARANQAMRNAIGGA